MSKLFMGAGESLQEVRSVALDEESLRDVAFRIKVQPNFLGEPLVVVAEGADFPQIHSGEDECALIALDVNGQAVVVELRTGTAAADSAMPGLKYASFLGRMSADELGKIAHAFVNRPANINILRAWRDSDVEMSDEAVEIASLLATMFDRDAEDYAGIVNRRQRVMLAAEEFDNRTVELIEWLNSAGVDIRGLQYRKYLVGGQEIFFAEQAVPSVDPAAADGREGAQQRQEADEPWRIRGLPYYVERLTPAMGNRLQELMALMREATFTVSYTHKYSYMVKGVRRNLRIRTYQRARIDIGFFNAGVDFVSEFLSAYGLDRYEPVTIGGYGSSPFVHVTSDTDLGNKWRAMLADWLDGAEPGSGLRPKQETPVVEPPE